MKPSALLFLLPAAAAFAQFNGAPPVVTLNFQNPVNVYGGGGSNIDLNNPDDVNVKFTRALATAGPDSTVILASGTYMMGNSGGPVLVNNFNGHLIFQAGAKIVLTDNTQTGIIFTGGSPHVTGMNITYQNLPTTVTGQYMAIFRGTQDAVLEDAMIVGSGAVGLQFVDSIRPKLHNVVVTNTMRGGVQIQNCRNASIDTLSTDSTGDDGLAFINYTSDPNPWTGATATNVTINNSQGSGIKVAGQSDVTVDGFVVDGTSGSGVFCLTDSAYGTANADRTSFNNGIVRNAGTVSPASVASGLEYRNVTSCSFSNIQVFGSASTTIAVPGVAGSAPSGSVVLSNIRVAGTGTQSGADGFDVGAGLLSISNCTSENAPGTAFSFSGGGVLKASNLTAMNASQSNSLHQAFWFGGRGFSAANGLVIVDTQSFPTGYVIGGTPAQTGVIDGVITHFSNGMMPTYAFLPGTIDLYNAHSR